VAFKAEVACDQGGFIAAGGHVVEDLIVIGGRFDIGECRSGAY
jgi:hypothetical protein